MNRAGWRAVTAVIITLIGVTTAALVIAQHGQGHPSAESGNSSGGSQSAGRSTHASTQELKDQCGRALPSPLKTVAPAPLGAVKLYWVRPGTDTLLPEKAQVFDAGEESTLESALGALFRRRDFFDAPIPNDCTATALWQGPGPMWVHRKGTLITVAVGVDAPVAQRHLALQEIVYTVLANAQGTPECGRWCALSRVTITTPDQTYARLTRDRALSPP